MFETEELDGSRILRYTLKENETVDRITLGMISNAFLPGFAGVTYIEENRAGTFSFFPGNVRPISDYLKAPVSAGIISQIVTDLADLYIRACAHLIPAEAMCCDPEHVYIDREGCVTMICVPVYPGLFGDSSETCIRRVLGLAVPESESASRYIEGLLGYVDGCGSFSWKQLKSIAVTLQPEAEQGNCAYISAEDCPVNEPEEETVYVSEEPVIDEAPEKPDEAAASAESLPGGKELTGELTLLSLLKNFSFSNLKIYRKSRKKGREERAASDDSEIKCAFDMIEDGCAYLIRRRTGGIVPVTADDFSIGKDPSRTVYTVFGNPAISRYHATIIKRDGCYFIRDNGSTNRTYIDGRMLDIGDTARIADGCVIRLANEDFEFTEGSPLTDKASSVHETEQK